MPVNCGRVQGWQIRRFDADFMLSYFIRVGLLRQYGFEVNSSADSLLLACDLSGRISN
jgi:hypothetical protein